MIAVGRRARRWSLSLLLGMLSGAPGVRADAAPVPDATPASCDARILVQLVRGLPAVPDKVWVRDLGAAAGVRLRYLRPLTPDLYLLRLRDERDAAGCEQALERLRRDPRVRSAELDKRRKHESA
ncbi:MAG: hypothetical protein ACRESY_05370 [Steroidobacteraceae bacterium]